MPNAFYRNSSSGGKKKSERERRGNVLAATELPSEVESTSAAEPADAREEGRGAVWSANITPSALITMSILLLVMLGFSFLSGVIVGRGSMPLPQALELERLVAPEGRAEKGERIEILPSEELHFMTSLKSDKPAPVLSEQAPQSKKVASAKNVASRPAPAKSEAKPAAPSAEKARKSTVDKTKAKEPLTDYVIRVAAFKNGDQAQILYRKLVKAGLQARFSKAKTKQGLWHYVQVHFRGTEKDLKRVGGKLKGFGLPDYIVISRKPVK